MCGPSLKGRKPRPGMDHLQPPLGQGWTISRAPKAPIEEQGVVGLGRPLRKHFRYCREATRQASQYGRPSSFTQQSFFVHSYLWNYFSKCHEINGYELVSWHSVIMPVFVLITIVVSELKKANRQTDKAVPVVFSTGVQKTKICKNGPDKVDLIT